MSTSKKLIEAEDCPEKRVGVETNNRFRTREEGE